MTTLHRQAWGVGDSFGRNAVRGTNCTRALLLSGRVCVSALGVAISCFSVGLFCITSSPALAAHDSHHQRASANGPGSFGRAVAQPLNVDQINTPGIKPRHFSRKGLYGPFLGHPMQGRTDTMPFRYSNPIPPPIFGSPVQSSRGIRIPLQSLHTRATHSLYCRSHRPRQRPL